MKYSKTKIICTIGPSSSNPDRLVEIINAGMDCARLNFSHGTHESHKENIKNIRKASEITGEPVAIMQDLQGPKIRTGKVEDGSVDLIDGDELTITCKEEVVGNSKRINATYKYLYKDVKPGNELLLDDGYIELYIKKIEGYDIITEVVKGGILKDNKGIIAPGVPITAPSLSEKDIADLEFGLNEGVDFVAMSFVRSEYDVKDLREKMNSFGRQVPIISKIERVEGLEDLNDIVMESDGIMIARGDLGLELPTEKVPGLQKEIIRKCNYHGKFVVTATQMLESMITNLRPTRAEASDVANAVIDGTDCVMLSGETSTGKYPVETVKWMDKIVNEAERECKRKDIAREVPDDRRLNIDDALSKASSILAEQINAAAIITITHSGYTAKYVSKYRPQVPIIAFTDDEVTQRQLNLSRGVIPFLLPEDMTGENAYDNLSKTAINKKIIKKGDFVIFLAGLSSGIIMPQNTLNVFEV